MNASTAWRGDDAAAILNGEGRYVSIWPAVNQRRTEIAHILTAAKRRMNHVIEYRSQVKGAGR